MSFVDLNCNDEVIMKSLPFLAGILMFFGLEAVFYWPKFFYIFLFLGSVVLVFVLKLIFKPGQKQKPLVNRGFFYFTILSLVFFIGVLSSALFIKHSILFYTIIIFASLLLFVFFNTLLREKIQTAEYGSMSYRAFNLASLFFVVSSIFGFIIFFRIPFWHLLPLVFLTNMFFVVQIIFMKEKESSFFDKRALIVSLLIVQFFVILNYLPITFFTAGLFLTIFYGLAIKLCPVVKIRNGSDKSDQRCVGTLLDRQA